MQIIGAFVTLQRWVICHIDLVRQFLSALIFLSGEIA